MAKYDLVFKGAEFLIAKPLGHVWSKDEKRLFNIVAAEVAVPKDGEDPEMVVVTKAGKVGVLTSDIDSMITEPVLVEKLIVDRIELVNIVRDEVAVEVK